MAGWTAPRVLPSTNRPCELRWIVTESKLSITASGRFCYLSNIFSVRKRKYVCRDLFIGHSSFLSLLKRCLECNLHCKQIHFIRRVVYFFLIKMSLIYPRIGYKEIETFLFKKRNNPPTNIYNELFLSYQIEITFKSKFLFLTDFKIATLAGMNFGSSVWHILELLQSNLWLCSFL